MFFEDDSAPKSNVEELLTELSNICLSELMLSSDAYICMIKMNMQGYKKLHRYIARTLYDLYLDIQNKSMENYGRILPIEQKFTKYTTTSLKEHLYDWNKILKKDLIRVGEIIRDIFNEEGYICCYAQSLQSLIYKNIIKNERAIQKFEDNDWSYDIIYKHNLYLKNKIKEIEK